MNWCVVIPTYNNEKTLEKVIRDALQVTRNIYVVNDGSTDSTSSILRKFPSISIISYARNRGKGFAIRKGLQKALEDGYTHAVTMDSDGQHYASDIMHFIRKAAELPDAIIVGSRTLPEDKMRQGSGFANRFSNFWFRFITGVSLPDTQSGFRLYPLEMTGKTRYFTRKYEFELEVLIRAAWNNVPLSSIPVGVYYPAREDRISHFRPFRDFARISVLNAICVIFALLYVKPFSFVRYLKKESVAGFIKKHVLQTGDSVSKITLSVMLGIFMGIVPIWGYQLVTAIALAYLLKLNKFIVIVAANISLPPMIPFILYFSYVTGGIILSSDNQVMFSHEINFVWIRDNLFQYVVGAVAFAVLAAIFFGILTIAFLKVVRRKPALIN